MTANIFLTAGSNEARSVVAEALRRLPGVTARKLAGQENLSLGVVTEALKVMEAAGTAIRTPGPTNGNRKSADLWEPAIPNNDATDTTPDTADEATPADSDASGNAAADEAATTNAMPGAADEATSADSDASGNAAADEATSTDTMPGAADEATPADSEASGNAAADEATSTDTTPGAADEATSADSEASGNAAADAAPVSGVPVSGVPSGAGDHLKIVMVAAVLGDYPDGVSAADVIDQSGLRAQVVARVLTAMEVAGAAVRKPGDSDSAPERWVRGEADLATVDLANAAPYRECVCTCGHKHRIKTGVTVTATRRAGRTTGESNTDGSPKLGKNGLRNQVEAFMRDLGPGHDLTPGTVGRELGGRSSGAVGNGMNKLNGLGVLIMTSEAPVKYALADNPPAPTGEVAALMTRTGADPSNTAGADGTTATT
ncbi:MarR family transcriptional regulator [Salinispora sp. H7-4]|uniref:MarR family transcriptional regulator n=1 Tax=Salinispora sp. H7-4 TaxID=2748321 RepID=UPI0015D27452|nr:MarR family transcriptional regulator [Salinispora sp. H7-4]NYT96160.1 MarR family transcriptional regulator [Salinispora sp. H7-4]